MNLEHIVEIHDPNRLYCLLMMAAIAVGVFFYAAWTFTGVLVAYWASERFRALPEDLRAALEEARLPLRADGMPDVDRYCERVKRAYRRRARLRRLRRQIGGAP